MPTTVTETPKVLTPAEVAAILRVDRNELYGRLRNGTVSFPVRRLGAKWVIPARPSFAWLEGETADPEGK